MKYENYKKKSLIGEGKHIVKLVDQQLIKLVKRLKDKSSKITRIHNKELRNTQNKHVNLMSKTLKMRGC